MTYYVEAWNLRDAVLSLRKARWDGKTTLALNRLKRRLDDAVSPMTEAIQNAPRERVQQYAESLGRQELDEAPKLPDEPLVSIEEIEELEDDIINGNQLELLQQFGVVESDEDGES